jgi:hypothetical protein
MPKSPPIPKEQRSSRGQRMDLTDHSLERRDDNAYNVNERGQTANMRQNMHRGQQDR